jgi:hypothetical protein
MPSSLCYSARVSFYLRLLFGLGRIIHSCDLGRLGPRGSFLSLDLRPMPQSDLRLVQRWGKRLPKFAVDKLPSGLRGFYVLYKYRRRTGSFDVVYVGMSASGSSGHIKRRLNSHRREKGTFWTHLSLFEVWDNIRDEEILELEGLFREIYRSDARANKLNKQRGFKKLRSIPRISLDDTK